MVWRRSAMLVVGLALYGVSLALVLRGGLGLAPWDVFHEGVADRIDQPIGRVIIVTSFVVLLLWIPIGERPGVGTLANAVLVGASVDATLAVIGDVDPLAARIALMAGGVALNGVATGLYIGARMGPGPRDGLMTGIARRGYSVRVVRTVIELIVVAIGVVLGGTIGVGTLAYAVGIGPIAHVTIPFFSRWSAPRGTP
ncbi:MAG: YczE/YyaS/YitT family protein [Ilumatobacteraceae bacterium]